MQFILTEEEYNTLQNSAAAKREEDTDTINKLCQLIANNVPVEVPWAWASKHPWGCIHTRGKDDWYCDQCPVKKECRLPKNWSK
jgi:hypothetical protein